MANFVEAAKTIAGGIARIGAAAKMAVSDLREAKDEAGRFAEAISTAQETTAGKSGTTGGVSTKGLAAALGAAAGRTGKS